jgi:hypothetical protein
MNTYLKSRNDRPPWSRSASVRVLMEAS